MRTGTFVWLLGFIKDQAKALITKGLKNIETFKKKIDEVSSTDNLAFVKFYEGNIDSIENIDIKIDEGHYNAKLRLESEYGMSLFGSGYYTQAVEVLSKVIPMFENVPNQKENKTKAQHYIKKHACLKLRQFSVSSVELQP